MQCNVLVPECCSLETAELSPPSSGSICASPVTTPDFDFWSNPESELENTSKKRDGRNQIKYKMAFSTGS